MRNACLIAWREFAENAKTKGFWIGLFLLPLILTMAIQIPILLERKGAPTRCFIMVDHSGQLAPAILEALERTHQQRVWQALSEYATRNTHAGGGPRDGAERDAVLKQLRANRPPSGDAAAGKGGKDFFLNQLRPFLNPGAPPFEEPRRQFRRVELPPDVSANAPISEQGQALKPYLRGTKQMQADGHPVELYAAILIPANLSELARPAEGAGASAAAGTRGIEYWSGNLADMKLREEVANIINGELRRREYVARGLDLKVIRQIENTQVRFAELNPKKEGGKEAVSTADTIRQWAPSVFVYLLWVAIFAIVQMLLNNTIEEKSNRIIEVLLSSVTPGELMMGKLIGIAAVGLTMTGFWVLSLVGVIVWKAGTTSAIAGPLLVVLRTSPLLPAFGLYFLLGFLLYAGIILSIGSVCNSLKEAQNCMAVVTLLLMLPLFTLAFIPKDPHGTLARVLSWIPLYTPFVMMNLAAADPPLWEVIGTLVLLLASVAFTLWLAGKIFRLGILRYGAPPRWLELWRWLRG